MKRTLSAIVLVAVAALSACSGRSTGALVPTASNDMQTSIASNATLGPQNGYYPMATPGGARQLCPAVKGSHAWRCMSWIRTDIHAAFAPDSIPAVGYTPADIESAYSLDVTKGSGQTVAIVDAYGYTKAASDLATYRAAAGLPPCAKGCLKIINQHAKQPAPSDPNFGWVFEQSLDLDAVSAACPLCHIILVQSKDSSHLAAGINAAAAAGAKIISMSFGGPESGPATAGFPSSGYAFVASAGDSGGGLKDGGGPQMPCTYAEIVCAGGTQLVNHNGSWSETVWNNLNVDKCGSGSSPCGATGSACSTIVPKPSWQTDTGCKKRSAADVAADASVLTPLAVYNSNINGPNGHWAGIGGTSLSAPLIAGVFGLAGNASSRHAAMEIWQNHSSLKNVTVGNNILLKVTGPCASKVSYICKAGSGYNGPTGWGSPMGSTDF